MLLDAFDPSLLRYSTPGQTISENHVGRLVFADAWRPSKHVHRES